MPKARKSAVYQRTLAARAADIASAKASLQLQHDIRAAGVQRLGATYSHAVTRPADAVRGETA